MSAQLRSDIIRALAAACKLVEAYELDASDIVEDVMQQIDGALRFVEPDQGVAEAHRAALERLESTMQLIERAAAAAQDRRSQRGAKTARAQAVGSINHPRATVLEQGRVKAAGDRVELGKTGVLLQ